MTATSLHPPAPIARFPRRLASLALLFAVASCVTTNLDTGEVVPRGNQRLPYDQVDRLSSKLQLGMTRLDVNMLLGSPAEKDAENNVWVYLPERYAILIPAMALRLEFRDGKLAEFEHRPIVLGARL